MKKKIAIMFIAGMTTIGLCACQGKEKPVDTASETAVQTESAASEDESASMEEADTEETKVSERADYVALEDLEIDDYVIIPDYKSITVQVVKEEVTEDSVESYINGNILTTYPVTDRAVADGDLVKIDFEGKLDGEAFEGGSAEGYKLQIGSNTFIEGFEEGLIGVTPGETVDLNLTFPKTYQKQELAGKEVVFTVTVQSILESTDYSKVTPEQMKAMGLSYTSKNELWEEAKKSVEEEVEENYQTNISNAIMEYLMNKSEFLSVPQPLVDEEVQNYNQYMEALCTGVYGCNLETFVTSYYQMTMDEYNAQLAEMSEDVVKQELIMEAIARQEGINVSEEELMAKAKDEAEEYGYESAEALLDEVGKSTYRMYMVQESVMEKLKEMTTVENTAPEEQSESESQTKED